MARPDMNRYGFQVHGAPAGGLIPGLGLVPYGGVDAGGAQQMQHLLGMMAVAGQQGGQYLGQAQQQFIIRDGAYLNLEALAPDLRAAVQEHYNVASQETQRRAAIAEQERLAKQRIVDEHADRLLSRFLTSEEFKTWKLTNRLLVTGRSGTQYIADGHFITPSNKPDAVICLAPPYNLPRADRVLTQKLWLESEKEDQIIARVSSVPVVPWRANVLCRMMDTMLGR